MYNVDPPTVSLQGTQRTIEGETFSFTCLYNPGYPALTTVYWKKENSSNRYTGQTLRLPDVRRTYSGEYVCVAENTYSSGNKGSTNSTMILDVQCQLSYLVCAIYLYFGIVVYMYSIKKNIAGSIRVFYFLSV